MVMKNVLVLTWYFLTVLQNAVEGASFYPVLERRMRRVEGKSIRGSRLSQNRENKVISTVTNKMVDQRQLVSENGKP